MDTTADIAPPPLAPAASVLLDDDDREALPLHTRTDEHRAEQIRESAFHAEYQWHRWDAEEQTWQPYRLELGLDRWTWWHRMELHNAPMPHAAWQDPATWSDAHVPTAWSLLFLCSHSPEDILALVAAPADYWQAVNAWAEIHCPGEKWAEALQLMRLIEQQQKATIATPRPTKKRARPGNAPSLWTTQPSS